MNEDLVRAYAILDLDLNARPPEIQARCRDLIEHARAGQTTDAASAVLGEQRVREVLTAYRTIRRHYASARRAFRRPPNSTAFARRISPQEIQTLAERLPDERLFDPFVAPFRWYADLFDWFYSALILVGLAGLVIRAILLGDAQVFLLDPEMLVLTVSIVLVVLWNWFKRRRRHHSDS